MKLAGIILMAFFTCCQDKGDLHGNHLVEIKSMKFVPAEILVNSGDTITFINKDFVDQAVTEENTKEWSFRIIKNGTPGKRFPVPMSTISVRYTY